MNPFYYVLSVNGLLFAFSLVFYLIPPKKINALYGYKTEKAMKNIDIWNFANSFFTKQLIKYAAIALVFTLFLAFISKNISWEPMTIAILSLAVSVIKTEQALTKNFNDEGERKK